jgi:hypothetical protein
LRAGGGKTAQAFQGRSNKCGAAISVVDKFSIGWDKNVVRSDSLAQRCNPALDRLRISLLFPRHASVKGSL